MFSFQIFLGYMEQSESWLSNKEAFLANEDLGVGTQMYLLINYVWTIYVGLFKGLMKAASDVLFKLWHWLIIAEFSIWCGDPPEKASPVWEHSGCSDGAGGRSGAVRPTADPAETLWLGQYQVQERVCAAQVEANNELWAKYFPVFKDCPYTNILFGVCNDFFCLCLLYLTQKTCLSPEKENCWKWVRFAGRLLKNLYNSRSSWVAAMRYEKLGLLDESTLTNSMLVWVYEVGMQD